MPRRKPGPTGRSAINLDNISDDVVLDAVRADRISSTGGSWMKLYGRMAALQPGKGFRVPLQQAGMDPERAARTVRSAVRAWVKKNDLPAGAFGVWALTSGIFVWRAKAED